MLSECAAGPAGGREARARRAAAQPGKRHGQRLPGAHTRRNSRHHPDNKFRPASANTETRRNGEALSLGAACFTWGVVRRPTKPGPPARANTREKGRRHVAGTRLLGEMPRPNRLN